MLAPKRLFLKKTLLCHQIIESATFKRKCIYIMRYSGEPEAGYTIGHKQVAFTSINSNAPLMTQLHTMHTT